MKKILSCILLAVALAACEGNADPFDDTYGISAEEMQKTVKKIDELPAEIKKDYLKSDSIIHNQMKKEIDLLKSEIKALKEEIQAIKKR
jgi:hypothetical protein